MASPQFLSLFQFDETKLVPSQKPLLLNNGSKSLPIDYIYPNKSQEKLNFVTAEVYLPFGLSCYRAGNSDPRWTADVSFYLKEENPNLNRLYEVAQKLDEIGIDLVHQKFESWFGKKKSLEVIKDQYCPLIRQSKPAGKYAPNLRVHANPDSEGNFKFNIYNNNGQLLPCKADERETEKVVPSKTKAKLLIEFSGLWFTAGNFGWSCNLKQLVVIPRNNTIDRPLITSIDYSEEGNLIERPKPMEFEPQQGFIET